MFSAPKEHSTQQGPSRWNRRVSLLVLLPLPRSIAVDKIPDDEFRAVRRAGIAVSAHDGLAAWARDTASAHDGLAAWARDTAEADQLVLHAELVPEEDRRVVVAIRGLVGFQRDHLGPDHRGVVGR